MTQTLAMMAREAYAHDTSLQQLRKRLNAADQDSFDRMLGLLKEYQIGAELIPQMDSIERALFLIAVQQHRRIECLEVLSQRQAQREIAEYLEQTTAGKWTEANTEHT